MWNASPAEDIPPTLAEILWPQARDGAVAIVAADVHAGTVSSVSWRVAHTHTPVWFLSWLSVEWLSIIVCCATVESRPARASGSHRCTPR